MVNFLVCDFYFCIRKRRGTRGRQSLETLPGTIFHVLLFCVVLSLFPFLGFHLSKS